jgi:DNA (cytosine-5)-methyltransferase 1
VRPCYGCAYHADVRPKMVDVCCCAGGTSVGYHRAGFCVTGVDINPQPRYPFRFIQADARAYLDHHADEYAVGAGSPPCQHWSPLNAYNHVDYPQLIEPVRDGFIAAGLPYVIENVEAAAPELKDPILLCGPMFGLKVYRHRLFEANWPLAAPPHFKHEALCARNGYLPTIGRPFMSIHGGRHSKAWQSAACEAMGLPHLDLRVSGADTKTAIREICEAIPPSYTDYIGCQLLAHLSAEEAA